MSALLLKLHAWFYRRTGIYTKYAKKQERKYMEKHSNLEDFQQSLLVGRWQAHHGFYRPFSKIRKKF